VADLILPTKIRKSDQEAFLIIGMYFSQCIENIRLFEDLYHNKDDLEKRIKERTNELVKSLRDIEIISKAKSTFISSVSHELRTPLTSVKGFSSLLVDEKFGKLPPQAKERLIKIDENVNKLMDIVNTLLDISRIESGKMEIKIAPFDITKLIKDVTDFLAPQIESKGLNLVLNIPEGLNVFIDKNLIERVLINLINNAIKFTPQGGKIEVSCKQENKKALISVSDTGCGIKKDDHDKIFQEFFRVEATTSIVKGSGLGLSLVKQIIDTHKEKIWIESEIDKGTTFYFTLKLAEK
jgi:Amt family ammonium transporter